MVGGISSIPLSQRRDRTGGVIARHKLAPYQMHGMLHDRQTSKALASARHPINLHLHCASNQGRTIFDQLAGNAKFPEYKSRTPGTSQEEHWESKKKMLGGEASKQSLKNILLRTRSATDRRHPAVLCSGKGRPNHSAHLGINDGGAFTYRPACKPGFGARLASAGRLQFALSRGWNVRTVDMPQLIKWETTTMRRANAPQPSIQSIAKSFSWWQKPYGKLHMWWLRVWIPRRPIGPTQAGRKKTYNVQKILLPKDKATNASWWHLSRPRLICPSPKCPDKLENPAQKGYEHEGVCIAHSFSCRK